MDNTDYKRDEIDDEAVEGADQGDFQAAADDGEADVAEHLDGVKDLIEAAQGPEDGDDQGGDADFPHPLRCFPCSDELADKQKGDCDHAHEASFYKQGGKGFADLLNDFRLGDAQGVDDVIDFFFHGKTVFNDLLQRYVMPYQ